jgi:hypothetical protein
MRMPLLVAAAAFPWLLACSGERAERPTPPAAPPPAPPPDTIVASDSADAVAILARLRTIAPTGGDGFDAASAPTFDPAAVLAVVSDSGLTLHDTNLKESATVQLSRQQVESQLARRRGRAFTSLVHLGYLYSQPYPQYSKLTFTRRTDVLEASVADWYRLRFVREGGRLRLRRVDYTMMEAEQAR